MTNLYLGLDGGGTKTEAIIINPDKQILGKGLAGGSNYHNLPKADTVANIQQSIRLALEAANLSQDSSFSGACLGVAGLDTSPEIEDFRSQVAPLIRTSKLMVCNDGLIGFKSGSNETTGICLIASTGSSCYGITPDNHTIKAGNWGYLMGDQGSGFSIGQQILKHAVKEYDGRKPSSDLLPAVISHFGATDFISLVEHIYQPMVPVSQIAGLAKMLSVPEWQHHSAIITIAQSAVGQLFEAFDTVVKKMNPEPSADIPVVLAGKLFLAKNMITEPLINKITSNHSSTKVTLPIKSAAEAASEIALSL